jgi:excisionase family DNA binding protein
LSGEAAVSDVLVDDIEVLRAALDDSPDNVCVTLVLPRQSAEKVLTLLDAERASGALVVPVRTSFTATEAATMLGLPRTKLIHLIAAGEIAHVLVGAHHRIPAQAILDFQHARRARRDQAAKALAAQFDEGVPAEA